jgi:hypothetical protein
MALPHSSQGVFMGIRSIAFLLAAAGLATSAFATAAPTSLPESTALIEETDLGMDGTHNLRDATSLHDDTDLLGVDGTHN